MTGQQNGWCVTRSIQCSYACLNFKVGSECLLQGIRLAIGLQYELPTCILNTTLPTLQGTSERATILGWGGVEDVLWIDFTLFVRFFDR